MLFEYITPVLFVIFWVSVVALLIWVPMSVPQLIRAHRLRNLAQKHNLQFLNPPPPFSYANTFIKDSKTRGKLKEFKFNILEGVLNSSNIKIFDSYFHNYYPLYIPPLLPAKDDFFAFSRRRTYIEFLGETKIIKKGFCGYASVKNIQRILENTTQNKY